jgi:hypothetical protein
VPQAGAEEGLFSDGQPQAESLGEAHAQLGAGLELIGLTQ